MKFRTEVRQGGCRPYLNKHPIEHKSMKTIRPIMKSHSGRKAALVPLALFGAACMSHASITLLTDPGFETQGTLPGFADVVTPNFSSTAGQWGAENGAFVGAENGVAPQGTRMLRMMDDGGVTTSAIQMISLAAYASAIAAGNASFNMSALFTSDSDRGAVAAIIATFYADDTSWGAPIAPGIGSSGTLDTNPATWQVLSGSGAIPVGAGWVGVQVYFNNASLFDGFNGYVDAHSEMAGFTVTTVPEPSGTILLGLGSGLLFVRRRRTTR